MKWLVLGLLLVGYFAYLSLFQSKLTSRVDQFEQYYSQAEKISEASLGR